MNPAEEARRLLFPQGRASAVVTQRGEIGNFPASSNVALGVYFSASWCPPCRQFTPLLRKFHEEANRRGTRLEIVFVSSDRSEAEFSEYFRAHHGPWLAVNFGASELRSRLGTLFGVRGIPAFFIEGQEARNSVVNGNFSLIDQLAKTAQVFTGLDQEAKDLLLLIGENILKSKGEEKFRVLKKTSAKIQAALLNKPHGAKPLLDLGFVEESEGGGNFRFTETLDALIGNIQRLRQTPVLPGPAAAVETPEILRCEVHAEGGGVATVEAALEDGGVEIFRALVESALEISDPILLAKTTEETKTLVLDSDETLKKLEISARGNSGRAKIFALRRRGWKFATDEEARQFQGDWAQLQHAGNGRMSEICRSEMSVVQLFEKPSAQRKALEVVPIGNLFGNSQLEFVQKLAGWFKKDFFRWMDKPRCGACNGSTEFSSQTEPSAGERSHGLASAVELYACTVCGSTARFVRFNNPEILLQTRTGRCGEFANCFGLICRALGLETRKVFPIDGDHVWLEVCLEISGQTRWVHVDPCEAAVDQPLLYEGGWGRKYSRVVAISRNECLDVTARYVLDFVQKPQFDQTDLQLIDQLARDAYLERCGADKDTVREFLDERRRRELQESRGRDIKTSELQGRTTGDESWRASRGESGNSK